MGGDFLYTTITIVTGAIATIISAATTWFFARRRNKAELENTILQNTTQNLEIYQRMLDDLDQRYREREAETQKEISNLKTEVIRLQKEVEDCRKRH